MTYLDGYDPILRVVFALCVIIVALLFMLVVLVYDNWQKQKEIDELMKSRRQARSYKSWSSKHDHRV